MKNIGLAGFGFIGSFLYERLTDNKEISVKAVWEPISEKTRLLDSQIVCQDLEDLGSRSLDLIIEVAHADVVKALLPIIKSDANVMIASMTCLSDPDLRKQVERDAIQKGRKIFLPHGAILGLDGLRDGRSLLENVSITTTKHPRSLGITNSQIKKPEILFEGSTRDACTKFPRNVNVHAAIALAGLGFEATRSVIIADPNTNKMHHRIEVHGRGLNWNLEIESFSAGEVTGSYTPESLYQSLLGILSGGNGFCIV